VNVSTVILVLSSLAAGLVDVLSFAKLGGVFTSAMTGNLALLGLYTATGALDSAVKSLSALGGFIIGCAVGTLQSRRKTTRTAVRTILGLETLVIVSCACVSLQPHLYASANILEVEILMLGFAMGLQSIVGILLKQTNVVFTATMIRIVTAVLGSTRADKTLTETKRETAVVIAYLVGALTGALLIKCQFAGVLLIAVVAVGVSFICAHRLELSDAKLRGN
jgi:uncharacterized membrane protein YoaK (UPF0700 family)